MDARRNFSMEGQELGDMASVEGEPVTGVWGRSPQRGPGTKPLID